MAVLGNLIMPRGFGGIIPDVTVEEHHHDEMALTHHPVERAAAITDHVYRMPSRVTIRAGWSNSLSGFSIIPDLSAVFDATVASRVQDIYDQLQRLQREMQLIQVYTGKRAYSNMLLQSLTVTTDEKTENVLMVTAEFQEVIVVDTQVVSVDNNALRDDVTERNTSLTDRGTQQLQPGAAYNPGATPGSAQVANWASDQAGVLGPVL